VAQRLPAFLDNPGLRNCWCNGNGPSRFDYVHCMDHRKKKRRPEWLVQTQLPIIILMIHLPLVAKSSLRNCGLPHLDDKARKALAVTPQAASGERFDLD
jgi:hypothetical protein